MAPLPTEPFGLQQSMPSTIGHNDHIPMWFVSHVIQILTIALVIVPKTLTNLHEEICKEIFESSTSVAASLVPILEAHRKKVQILPCY